MKIKLYKGLVSAVLAAAMLCLASACGSPAADSIETTAADVPAVTSAEQTAEITEAPHVDENGFELDNVPEDLKFNGKTVTLLYWSDREHEEFIAEAQNGENINDAMFVRNTAIEKRLDIKMEFTGIPGNYNQREGWFTHIETAIKSGDHAFDAAGGYSLNMASCAAKGFLFNLLDSDFQYLDFSQPWWPEKLLSEATINNKLYFCSGDISANMLYMLYVCFVNDDMVKDLGLENVNALVNDGKWTYDKFLEMASGVYTDQNGNGKKDIGDRFGYIGYDIHMDPWFYGTGAVMIDKGDNDALQFSDSQTGERVISTIERFNSLLWSSNDGIYDSSATSEFAKGNSMFCTERCRASFRNFNDTTVNYSIVPFPKYDADTDYVTTVANPYTIYAIPSDAPAEDPGLLSAYLEIFASESYRTVTPQIYEVSLKYKYSRNADTAQMYDLIRSKITFDLGRLFNNELGDSQKDFRGMFAANTNAWATQMKVKLKTRAAQLQKIQDSFS